MVDVDVVDVVMTHLLEVEKGWWWTRLSVSLRHLVVVM